MPAVADRPRDAQGRFCRKVGGVPPFPDARLVHKWDDGMQLAKMMTAADLAVLSANGGGCSKDHAYWVENDKSEFFFVLVNAKGRVGTILFCKRLELYGRKHPDERVVKGQPWGWIASDYYDRGYNPPKPGQPIESPYVVYAKGDLHAAERYYERIKEEAIAQWGPLGRGHPAKWQVDDANRRVVACRAAVARAEQSAMLHDGQTFEFEGNKLVIIQVAGRGVDYDAGKNTRYTDKLAEWCGPPVYL